MKRLLLTMVHSRADLAEAAGAVVDHGGDLGQVGVALGVGQLRDAAGPGVLRLGEQRADPGVQDSGDVPGPSQVGSLLHSL